MIQNGWPWFYGDEERMLEFFAGQAAIAIENVKHYRNQKVLVEIGQAAATLGGPQSVEEITVIRAPRTMCIWI